MLLTSCPSFSLMDHHLNLPCQALNHLICLLWYSLYLHNWRQVDLLLLACLEPSKNPTPQPHFNSSFLLKVACVQYEGPVDVTVILNFTVSNFNVILFIITPFLLAKQRPNLFPTTAVSYFLTSNSQIYFTFKCSFLMKFVIVGHEQRTRFPGKSSTKLPFHCCALKNETNGFC